MPDSITVKECRDLRHDAMTSIQKTILHNEEINAAAQEKRDEKFYDMLSVIKTIELSAVRREERVKGLGKAFVNLSIGHGIIGTLIAGALWFIFSTQSTALKIVTESAIRIEDNARHIRFNEERITTLDLLNH